MALRKGFGAQLSGVNADDLRYDLAGTVVRSAAGVPRSGLFSPVASSLLTPTASMAVGIAAFSGVALRDNGVVFLANVGADSVTLTAPPSSNSRLDVIWAKQNDFSAYVSTPDANNTPGFGVLAGVASASPVRNPAGLPQGAIELGTVLVPSTATNTGSAGVVITPTFQYTAMAGGVFEVRNQTEKAALSVVPDQHVWLRDSQTEEVWDGTNWRGGPWIAGTLTAGWVSGGSAGGGTLWAPFRYRLNVAGEVEIQGQLTPPSAVAPSAVFFTLPAGFRPAGQLEFPCSINTNAGRTLAGCQITAAGQMSFSAGSIQNVNLGQIVFATN